ncbi:hypothetical protein [Polycladidibacter stylochi]|uniref:hypothetical protein n=1 Tax=Polycladidibacter stylochi TaxID=1807766 RepID=UPI0008326022|nr:hypothetical protein [Pseudovibrio stylochi]
MSQLIKAISICAGLYGPIEEQPSNIWLQQYARDTRRPVKSVIVDKRKIIAPLDQVPYWFQQPNRSWLVIPEHIEHKKKLNIAQVALKNGIRPGFLLPESPLILYRSPQKLRETYELVKVGALAVQPQKKIELAKRYKSALLLAGLGLPVSGFMFIASDAAYSRPVDGLILFTKKTPDYPELYPMIIKEKQRSVVPVFFNTSIAVGAKASTQVNPNETNFQPETYTYKWRFLGADFESGPDSITTDFWGKLVLAAVAFSAYFLSYIVLPVGSASELLSSLFGWLAVVVSAVTTVLLFFALVAGRLGK